MKSDALRMAEIEARTQLQSQVLALLQDPLWSTILGFVAVYKLEKRGWLPGGWQDEALYLGIIGINTARVPALAELAGKGISAAASFGAGAAVGVGVAGAARSVASRAGGLSRSVFRRVIPRMQVGSVLGVAAILPAMASYVAANQDKKQLVEDRSTGDLYLGGVRIGNSGVT